MKKVLGIIGFGKMAEMIAKGLSKSGHDSEKIEIVFYTPNAEKREKIKQKYGFIAKKSSREIYELADVVLLAVKPQKLSAVVTEIGQETLLKYKPLILSVLAGVQLEKLEKAFLQERLVRVMPNTAASVFSAMSTLTANNSLSDLDRHYAEAVFGAVGQILWIEEGYLDASSALNGSSPAFLYLIAEALADGGVKNGLSRSLAEQLVADVFIGVGKMLKESGKSSFALKTEVSSPGGMTIEGLMAMEAHSVRYAMIEAVTKAKERSEKLGKEA